MLLVDQFWQAGSLSTFFFFLRPWAAWGIPVDGVVPTATQKSKAQEFDLRIITARHS